MSVLHIENLVLLQIYNKKIIKTNQESKMMT